MVSILYDMTPKQLDGIISHYKKKAIDAYEDDDTFTCNRMITIVHDLEGNYDEYLGYEYEDDNLEFFFECIIPEVKQKYFLMFREIDPYENVDKYEVLEWMEETEEDFDEEFDEDFDLF